MKLLEFLKSLLIIISFAVVIRILKSGHFLNTSVVISPDIFHSHQHVAAIRNGAITRTTQKNTILQKPEATTFVPETKTSKLETKTSKLETKTSKLETKTSKLERKTSKLETKTAKPEIKTNITTSKTLLYRSDVCSNCFKHDFKYLIRNETICNHTKNTTIDLIIVIFTMHKNVKERNNIRQTWLDISKGNSANVRYAFLLGKTDNKKVMNSVIKENKMHGDIIMEDFKDTYANLTYKTIMGMKWATLNCSDARFILKTDDDMWVNVPEMLKIVTSHEEQLQTRVGGACENVTVPIRDRGSKWYTSLQSYPHNRYPGFCSGTGYVTSMAVAKKLYQVSPDIPFFHLEDVYIALCIKKLGMTLLRLKGFHNWRTALDPCQMRSAGVLTSHQVPSDFLHKVMAANCSSVVKHPDVKG